jgi:heptosyltransferase-2
VNIVVPIINARMTRLKILILSPAWIGDMVISHALIRFLKQALPLSTIDVLAPPGTAMLAQRMPEISQVFTLDIHHSLHLKKRLAMAKILKHRHYDYAIVLPNSFKSALIPFLARIPQRIGYHGEGRYFLLNHRFALDEKATPRLIDRYLALGQKLLALLKLPFTMASLDLYLPKLAMDKDNQSQWQNVLALNQKKPVITLCPGAEYGPAKRWPLDYFIALAKACEEKGYHVVLLGGPNEIGLAEIMVSAVPLIKNAVGKTSILDAIDVLSLSTFVVSNDSGLMHVAAALDKPLIALYGSSSPDYTPPLSKQAKIIYLKLWCSPCFKRVCPLEGEQHLRCLQDISVEEVFGQIIRSLEK